MEMERITLSQRERDRLKVWHEVQQKRLTQVAAAARLKVTDRQVRRMLLRIREHGDGALVHGLRGRPSNRYMAVRFEQKVLTRCGRNRTAIGRKPLVAVPRALSAPAPVSRTGAALRKSFRPTASRTRGTNTKTQKQTQTQIPCA
jgi:hypothetical protein